MYEMDGFGALDALEGAISAAVPVVVGGGVAFGGAQVVDLMIKNPTAKKWKWAIGWAAGMAVGFGLWQFRSPEEGAVAMATSTATALMGFGYDKILAYKAEKGLAGMRGLGMYQLNPAKPLFQGAGLGEYKVADAQPLFAGIPGVPDEIVALGQLVNDPALVVG